eukprot:122645-Prymnesium_polylepis.1
MKSAVLILALVAGAQASSPTLAVRRPRSSSLSLSPAFLTAQQKDLGSAVGSGGLLGFCAGRAAKAAGNAATVATGCTFIFLSALQKYGYITIHYEKVEKDIRGLADINKDGKIDMADANLVSSKVLTLITENAGSAAGGVAAGFALGFKTG